MSRNRPNVGTKPTADRLKGAFSEEAQRPVSRGGISMNPETNTVSVGERIIKLAPREFLFLKTLLKSPEKTVPAEDLYQEVYGGREVVIGNLRVIATRLRHKLEPDGIEILASSGRGYYAHVEEGLNYEFNNASHGRLITFNGETLDVANQTLQTRSSRIELNAQPALILQVLMMADGQPLGISQFRQFLVNEALENRTLKVAISRLNKDLKKGDSSLSIENTFGVGYRLTSSDKTPEPSCNPERAL